MTRTKLADRVLPDYTRGEETTNMITHVLGAVFGAAALVFCVLSAARRGDVYRVVGASVYGASLILLYTMSSVYHGLRMSTGKKVMQVIDHCTIYLLIAGSYTPILLGPLREDSAALAWTIFGLVWGISAVAAVFTAIDHNRYRKLSMACYIGIGWVIILALKPTVRAVTLRGLLFLLSGGIAYTVGAVLYSIGKKQGRRYMHSVFHVFVLLGTVLQFVTIYCFCM